MITYKHLNTVSLLATDRIAFHSPGSPLSPWPPVQHHQTIHPSIYLFALITRSSYPLAVFICYYTHCISLPARSCYSLAHCDVCIFSCCVHFLCCWLGKTHTMHKQMPPHSLPLVRFAVSLDRPPPSLHSPCHPSVLKEVGWERKQSELHSMEAMSSPLFSQNSQTIRRSSLKFPTSSCILQRK